MNGASGPGSDRSRLWLQVAITLASVVPIGAGAWGIISGTGGEGTTSLDSHYRYLSGLLLAIGIAWLVSVPRIEQHSARILLLTSIVVAGGLARVVALVAEGRPATPMLLALVMELGVTPLLCLWQRRVAARAG